MILLGVLLLQLQAPGVPLSPFGMKKAETLLRDKLPCLGCHEVGGDGGRIAPSLSDMTGRDLAFVRAMIRNPARTIPGTLMPRVPLDSSTIDLVARYLRQRAPTTPARRLLPPPVPVPAAADSQTASLYARRCAPCHGTRGDGQGYNARYLPVRPTAHRSSEYMARRSDDVLYDAIAAGGRIMGKSNRMPPFGETLSPQQIRALVRYLRVLCACEGPAWSRDNR